MESRVIGPKEFGRIFNVSAHTAAEHISNHPRRINIGLGTKKYWRLPIEVVEEILSGIQPLSSIEGKSKAIAKPKSKPRSQKPQTSCYIQKR